jgi:hypothetical protein
MKNYNYMFLLINIISWGGGAGAQTDLSQSTWLILPFAAGVKSL